MSFDHQEEATFECTHIETMVRSENKAEAKTEEKETKRKAKRKPRRKRKWKKNEGTATIQVIQPNDNGGTAMTIKPNESKVKTKNELKKKKAKTPMTEEEIAKMKAWISNRRNQVAQGEERKSLSFQWKSIPVPRNVDASIGPRLVQRGEYNALSDAQKEVIAQYIVSSNVPMTLLQAISLRAALLQEKTMRRHHIVVGAQAKEIVRRYEHGQGILSLSKSYDVPPVNLFRSVLSSRGFQKAKMKKCLTDPERHLEERDCKELLQACKEDIVSNPDCDKAHQQAELFESITAKFLCHQGIAFVTQDILVREQKSRFGKIIASPDFLLLDDVTVNGKSVRWIDCKAFYGADVNCRRFGVQKQSSRYHEYWGNGAVLFLEGFSEGLVTMDSHACCFLSAREFMNEGYLQPLEELNQQQQKQKR